MSDAEYLKLIEDSIEKMDKLIWQREQLDIDIARLQQFIQATVNLLPDEATKKFQARLAELVKESEIASAGLTDAIRNILQAKYPEWLTVTNVRDLLMAGGFDFSSYKSNPLAAIATTLRRLGKAEDDVQVSQIDGSVNVYRMPSQLAKLAEISQAISGKRKKSAPSLNDPDNPLYTSGMRPRPAKK